MLQRASTSLQAVALRAAGALVGLVLVVALLVLILKWGPEWLANKRLTGKDAAEEVGRIRTALLASVAGVIAIVGAIFTGLSYRLNRAGQITERFTRAIDQLGSSELDVRLGGIYALERIARDSGDDHPQVIEVLTAYVREHARWQPSGRRPPSSPAAGFEPGDERMQAIRALERIATGSRAQTETDTRPPLGEPDEGAEFPDQPRMPTDVQAAMTVLGRRHASRDRASLDLSRTDLRDVDLSRAHLEGTWLNGANLQGARLDSTTLEGAGLAEANLEGASLFQTNLRGARLHRANLKRARLVDANLKGARLAEANLEGAWLVEANLEGARLHGANLQGARLLGANLAGAGYDAKTIWPEGFDPAPAGAIRIFE